ncbi:glycosyltransferase [Oxalobacteraceae bacterium A2-2]
MIGVIVPAHDEQALLPDCLHALRVAGGHPALDGEQVCIMVVLDACTDGSAAIARRHARASTGAAVRVRHLALEARNVGAARAAGAQALLERGARWLACTDADSRVAPDWLAAQLALQADAVCGTVQVHDWSAHREHAPLLARHYARHYRDVDGHRHIHGANLGVSAEAYRMAGGFPPLRSHEDVALVEALERGGARIAWSAAPRVATSARRDARAREGFGDTMLRIVAAQLAAGHAA